MRAKASHSFFYTLASMFYIYIIQSKENSQFYVGHSSDPWRRLLEHNTVKTEASTGKYADWELVAVFSVSPERSDALVVERLIKKQKSQRLIGMLIDPDFIPQKKLAQLVRVPHVRD
ncbi:MAG: GIY-YIG nuclease family protein [Bacteroidetes bacterium]|nr:GIY-YIG nuclease family protein [Bacteroidota bacterium]